MIRMQGIKVMDTYSIWKVTRFGSWTAIFFIISLNVLVPAPLNSCLVNYAKDNHICYENKNIPISSKVANYLDKMLIYLTMSVVILFRRDNVLNMLGIFLDGQFDLIWFQNTCS